MQDRCASGDVGPIVIGQRVNVQDGAIIHCDTGITNHREDDVSIAHGAVVTPGTIVPDRHLVAGVPAKVIRPLKDEELKYLRWVPQRCILLAQEWIDVVRDAPSAPPLMTLMTQPRRHWSVCRCLRGRRI